jgi:hypothetical protein
MVSISGEWPQAKGGTKEARSRWPIERIGRPEPMSGHFTRDRLLRRIVGAVSLLILTCIAIFGVAHYFVA